MIEEYRRLAGAFAGAGLALACLGWVTAAQAEDNDPRPAKALQDNSFLIEEAYNQEPGVVQHILGLRRQGRDWELVFTQEWPVFSQMHQFSYSIPYARLRSDGQRASGLGDIFLNYRLQVLSETASLPAFAPRISLIVPSGDERRGLGDGSSGIQINLPFSKIVTDRVTLHANAGFTRLFDVQGLRPTTYTVGGSAVYAVSRQLNFLFEAVGEWAETVETPALLTRERLLTLSPGVRYAFNFADGAQLVLGAGAPVVLTEGKRPSYGAILYLSYEHSFLKKP
jgi:hypothetical protein